jgi:hypothetical protein
LTARHAWPPGETFADGDARPLDEHECDAGCADQHERTKHCDEPMVGGGARREISERWKGEHERQHDPL